MSNQAILSPVREKTSLVVVSGNTYNISCSYHNLPGIPGYVVGIKFSDRTNSMDSSKSGNTHAFKLAIAIGERAIQMIRPDLNKTSIIGFYLLTDDLSARNPKAIQLKQRVYGNQAILMHEKVKHKLPKLTMLRTSGGLGWTMSSHDFQSSETFNIFQRELGKRLELLPC